MLTFRADVFSWIPQPDVLNPIHMLPGGVSRWGPGACGPRFGGDNLKAPPNSYAGWNNQTFRATQTLAFKITSFGARPDIALDTGVVPGVTTVLSAPRSAGGRICSSLKATVTQSSSDITWNSSEQWYELRMHGAAHDPIPEAALKGVIGDSGASIGAALTPDLEWNILICIQQNSVINSKLSKLRYGVSSLLNLDDSENIAAPRDLGGTDNLMHGLAYVRRFPSYVVYMSVSSDSKGIVSLPVYFSDASERGLEQILVGQSDPIRQVNW